MISDTKNPYVAVLQRSDPTSGLIQYIQHIKPYHSKLLEVMTELRWSDAVDMTIKDKMFLDGQLTIFKKKPVFPEGFGFIWDMQPHLPFGLHQISGVVDGLPKNIVTNDQFGDEWDAPDGYDYEVYSIIRPYEYTLVGVVAGPPTIQYDNSEFGAEYDEDEGFDWETVTETILNPGGICRWIVSGDHTDVFVPGFQFIVANGARGNGSYTVDTVSLVGGNTEVVTVENIPAGATADGIIRHREYLTECDDCHWVIRGDFTNEFIPGQRFIVSSNNEGSNAYTVESSNFDGTYTRIYPEENIAQGSLTVGLIYIIYPQMDIVLDAVPAEYQINSVVPGSNLIAIIGHHVGFYVGQLIYIRDHENTLTNATYSVGSVSYVGSETHIVVNESLDPASNVGFLGNVYTPNDDTNYFLVQGDATRKYVDGFRMKVVESLTSVETQYTIHRRIFDGTNTKVFVAENSKVVKDSSEPTFGQIHLDNGGYDIPVNGYLLDADMLHVEVSVRERFSFREIV